MKNTSVALLLAVVLCGGTARGNKATFASFRKDYYLSDKVYPELFTPNPTHGGRIHIVSSIDSTITFSAPYTVKIGDVSANTDPEKGSSSFGDNFDWLHVDINTFTQIRIWWGAENILHLTRRPLSLGWRKARPLTWII